MNHDHYAVILAGGTGSRFWPMSRAAYPKQFLDILETGKSLLQSTYDRFHAFIPNANIFIVTSEEYTPLVKQQLPCIGESNIIGEPERKNTAACIAYISFVIKELNPSASLIVSPSDHLIKNDAQFYHHCMQTLQFCSQHNALVTLGILPGNPNTGFGYIQYGKTPVDTGVFPVKRFTEKPNLQTAVEFLKQGSYLWNAGIFTWKATCILAAFEQYMPQLYEQFKVAFETRQPAEREKNIREIYKNCSSISIDYAILEKASNVFVIPTGFEWSDLGTWNSAWENFNKDEHQNALAGEDIVALDTRSCMVHNTGKKLLVLAGLDDLIVINTQDVILICKKENEQQIKDYVLKVKEVKGEMYL